MYSNAGPSGSFHLSQLSAMDLDTQSILFLIMAWKLPFDAFIQSHLEYIYNKKSFIRR